MGSLPAPMGRIHDRAMPDLKLKFKTFAINVCPKSTKTFVIG